MLLVILIFMHVRYSTRLTWLFVAAGFIWLLIMIDLTMSDYLTRAWVKRPESVTKKSSRTLSRQQKKTPSRWPKRKRPDSRGDGAAAITGQVIYVDSGYQIMGM